jgi:hypothetical protein
MWMTFSQISEDSNQGKDSFNFYLGTNNPYNLMNNPNVGNMASCFSHHQKGQTLDLLHIHLIMLENQQFSLHKFFCRLSTPYYHLKNIQTIVIIHFLVGKTTIIFYQWMQMLITFHEHGYNDIVSYSLIMINERRH